MASPPPSPLSQIPMENQKQELMPDEEEEVLSLQRHCSSSDDGGGNNNNKTSANTALLVDIFSTNGNENGNGTRISSLISSSSNNSLNEDSETPKVGVSSPCTVSPHKHSGDDDKDKDESEEKAHHLNSVYFDQHHGMLLLNLINISLLFFSVHSTTFHLILLQILLLKLSSSPLNLRK